VIGHITVPPENKCCRLTKGIPMSGPVIWHSHTIHAVRGHSIRSFELPAGRPQMTSSAHVPYRPRQKMLQLSAVMNYMDMCAQLRDTAARFVRKGTNARTSVAVTNASAAIEINRLDYNAYNVRSFTTHTDDVHIDARTCPS